jgi:hypothetical protein
MYKAHIYHQIKLFHNLLGLKKATYSGFQIKLGAKALGQVFVKISVLGTWSVGKGSPGTSKIIEGIGPFAILLSSYYSLVLVLGYSIQLGFAGFPPLRPRRSCP